ncbi:MAG: pyruvate-formate lyase-activating enzyme [Solidesulfovibrio magneticus str. Maddingley MBC34]|uniref:Pyruvate-formate lyase-activating enzyme n=1 Tax=Solidesulfovibrio magneticus str. Maddingley MBC34 TaxID=1206767 RepID=K6HBA5_9BACT|nr:MAG: pyruvate-formate lyase-activating enzyme [Solidesulfovibrio magneticus str. Maddingley MBC34]
MRCPVCARACALVSGKVGGCGRYAVEGDTVVERFPDRYLIASPISVETIPLLHFHPGAPFFQISTVGCNFNCPGCIATVTAREMRPDSPALRRLSPAEVVDLAEEQGCRGVAFLMNDPLASYYTFVNVAREAKARGLLVACATNGYFSEASLAPLLGLLDGVNIGVKGCGPDGIRACGGGDPQVVLRNVRALAAAGTHVEIACMDRLDNRDDTRLLARTLAEVSPDMPLQLMRYVPIETADPALEPSSASTEAFAAELRRTLPFTYVFNTPGSRGLDTVCPDCGEDVVARDFYGPMGARLLSLAPGVSDADVRCARCGRDAAVAGAVSPPQMREGAFQGGYPFTRGLEIVESMCLAMGVRDQAEVAAAWEYLLARKMLERLHHDIQHVDGYLGLVRDFGGALGREADAARVIDFLLSMIEPVRRGVAEATRRPRTYYAMGKPLFAIMGSRFENSLVQEAGGLSCNKLMDLKGRPGRTIEAKALERLDPEVIFISSFLSNSPEAFLEECRSLGLDVPAVREGRVYTSPTPASDFGPPKWVLGLRFLAGKLHPDRFDFDMKADTALYHKTLFGRDFPLASINRSFAKPSRQWRFAEAGAASA